LIQCDPYLRFFHLATVELTFFRQNSNVYVLIFACFYFRQDESSVENAVKLDGSEFKGRQLKVTAKRVNVPNFQGGRGRGRGGRGPPGGRFGRGGRGGRGYRGGYRGGGRGGYYPY